MNPYMWEDTFRPNLGSNIHPDMMISEINARPANKTEYTSQESLGPSSDARTTMNISNKLQRRLARNREYACKSRLRKKTYVQQLESGRMKLAQLEEDLEMARCQGVYGSLLKTGSSGIATFEVEYQSWLAEQRKKDDELRKVLLTHTSDIELQIYVGDGLNHYHELFRMKACASKADVFYLMNGLWTTPVERFFQWIGGFRPSDILSILMPQLQLTDTQLMKARSLKQSCEQAEEGLSQGLEKLQQTLAQCIMIDITGAGSYSTQMNSTMKRLEALETFFNQADHLRQQTLQQMYQILTLIQTANALLALGEYFQRLRVLSSIWSSRPRNPTTLLS